MMFACVESCGSRRIAAPMAYIGFGSSCMIAGLTDSTLRGPPTAVSARRVNRR